MATRTRKRPKDMSLPELFTVLAELDSAAEAAAEANGWDFDHPDVTRLMAEKDPYAAELSRRDSERQSARKSKQDAAQEKQRAAARKKNAAAGRKYSPDPEDREAVLREALKGVHRALAEGKQDAFYSMLLGNRSRKRQQAIRELAEEGYLKKVSRGGRGMGSLTRETEAYGGQGYTITPEGEAHLREILEGRGERLPDPPTSAKTSAKVVPRPKLDAAPPRVRDTPAKPSVGASSRLAADRYQVVSTITRGVVEAVQALWADIPQDRIFDALQGELGKQILNAVISGQLSAAAGAEAFVSGAMLAQGAGTSAAARLNPGSLAGIAMDGRPLASLLQVPAITTAQALQAGLPADAALTRGMAQMATLVGTTIQDTARTATQVAMTAESKCISYVRVVKLPACSRCIVLAGRQYTYSEGFKRHPKCDCGMEPMSDAEWRRRERAGSPEDLFAQMSPEERRKRFGAAGADAIEQGADIGQVVNARRGMATTTTGKKVSIEGTARRGIAGKAMESEFQKVNGRRYMRTREARLMPEQILKNAHGNRELQIALLKKHGYIT